LLDEANKTKLVELPAEFPPANLMITPTPSGGWAAVGSDKDEDVALTQGLDSPFVEKCIRG